MKGNYSNFSDELITKTALMFTDESRKVLPSGPYQDLDWLEWWSGKTNRSYPNHFGTSSNLLDEMYILAAELLKR